jgi:hypothetical protein
LYETLESLQQHPQHLRAFSNTSTFSGKVKTPEQAFEEPDDLPFG